VFVISYFVRLLLQEVAAIQPRLQSAIAGLEKKELHQAYQVISDPALLLTLDCLVSLAGGGGGNGICNCLSRLSVQARNVAPLTPLRLPCDDSELFAQIPPPPYSLGELTSCPSGLVGFLQLQHQDAGVVRHGSGADRQPLRHGCAW